MTRRVLQRLGLARTPGTTPAPLPRVAGRIYTTTVAVALVLVLIGLVRAVTVDIAAAYPFVLPGLGLNLAAQAWYIQYQRARTRRT